MKKLAIVVALILCYFVFAILLNSVGSVILQVQGTFGVTKSDASVLEAFKDLTIAISSFVIASFLPLLGIKRGMLIGLAAVTLACLSMPMLADGFWYFKVLFMIIGISFALVKIGVFTVIGLIAEDSKKHSSLMAWIEGFFMIGVLMGNVLFSFFVDDQNMQSTSWLNVYYILAIISGIVFFVLLSAHIDESEASTEQQNLTTSISGMLRLVLKPLVLIFIISVFLYVLIEQSFQTWMPTFYNQVLALPNSMSIQAGAILAGAFALGRILAGFFLRKIHWLPFVIGCLVLLAVCISINVPLSRSVAIDASTNWFNAPLIVYIFPLMGVFLSPIYPTVNSVILSSLPKPLHSAMSGLIVIFSALGGTTGSLITGMTFDRFDGITAFMFSLVPIAILTIALLIFNRLQQKSISNPS